MNLNLNENGCNLDFNDIFNETDCYLLSERAVKREQVYINNAKLASKSGKNVSDSIVSH